MSPSCALRFYVQEQSKLHGILLHDWLLEDARRHGVPGGSAFRAIAGYGRHGDLHEQRFLELAGQLPVVVEFLLADEQAEAMLALLRAEKVSVFYSRYPIEFGIIQGNP